MNVNQKGVKGLIRVIDDLTDKNYYVFPAFEDHSPVDLIAMNHCGRTFRIQIKYRSRMTNKVTPSYSVQSSSVINGIRVPIDKTLIDGWALYMVEDKKIVYVPVCEISKAKIIHPDDKFDWELNGK